MLLSDLPDCSCCVSSEPLIPSSFAVSVIDGGAGREDDCVFQTADPAPPIAPTFMARSFLWFDSPAPARPQLLFGTNAQPQARISFELGKNRRGQAALRTVSGPVSW